MAVEFPLFNQLPLELREEIWRYCLPYRVYELDIPLVRNVYFDCDEENGPWPCMLSYATYMNGRPPLISRVCRESRSIAFKTGSIVPIDDSRPEEAKWGSSLDTTGAWRDSTRDAAHLNWVSPIEFIGDHGNPIHALAWDASHLFGGGSFMVDYLDEYFGCLNPEDPDEPEILKPLNPQKLEDLEALKQLPNWLVVMRVIVVHSDHETAAGFFGLLGDARVQIIEVSDETKIEAFLELAEACERKLPVRVKQDFHRESAESVKQKLRRIVMEQLQCEELAAALRPAVMFRFCTRNCANSNPAPFFTYNTACVGKLGQCYHRSNAWCNDTMGSSCSGAILD